MIYDLTSPTDPQVVGGSDPGNPQNNPLPKPVDQSSTAVKVAEILAAGYAIDKAAKLIAALLTGPSRVSFSVIGNVLALIGYRPKGKEIVASPTVRLVGNPDAPYTEIDGLGRKIYEAAENQERFYQAAYVVKSGMRLQQHLQDTVDAHNAKAEFEGVLSFDKTAVFRGALADESLLYRRHQRASLGRLNSAAKAAAAAAMFGQILGWYLNPALNNEWECIAADGNNFDATEGTIIGWPGSAHVGCGCTAGPPHENGVMVNDAVRRRMSSGANTVRLKEA